MNHEHDRVSLSEEKDIELMLNDRREVIEYSLSSKAQRRTNEEPKIIEENALAYQMTEIDRDAKSPTFLMTISTTRTKQKNSNFYKK